MNMENENPMASLYMVDKDLSVHEKVTDVIISNGVAWTKDCKTMIYIDSPTRRVFAFDFSNASGAISNRRVIIQFTNEEGVPDGCTLDDQDHLWIAHWNGGRVTRRDIHTVEGLRTILLPCPKITSVAFGGHNLDELYITTARKDDGDKFPLAGGLFRIKMNGIKGKTMMKGFKYIKGT
jgi:sugar lactone lactonase YvrE